MGISFQSVTTFNRRVTEEVVAEGPQIEGDILVGTDKLCPFEEGFPLGKVGNGPLLRFSRFFGLFGRGGIGLILFGRSLYLLRLGIGLFSFCRFLYLLGGGIGLLFLRLFDQFFPFCHLFGRQALKFRLPLQGVNRLGGELSSRLSQLLGDRPPLGRRQILGRRRLIWRHPRHRRKHSHTRHLGGRCGGCSRILRPRAGEMRNHGKNSCHYYNTDYIPPFSIHHVHASTFL